MNNEEINIGDRVEHGIYGYGFVSSHSNFGKDAIFIAFDGRKDMIWTESDDVRKVF